ncbi:MAG TPA: hypothetical protein VF157_08805 [Chloroflexota bacterium]
MLCRDVRAALLVPETPAPTPDLQEHLAVCRACAGLASALATLDAQLRSALVVAPQSQFLVMPVDAVLRSALVVEPPAEVRARLTALADIAAADAARARVDTALRSALLVEPPPAVQARLLAAAGAEAGSWFARVWDSLRSRPGVFAGQLAALAVLGYAVMQLVAWIGSLPVVLGDVPYALELLAFSPALDYLSSIQALLQQLGPWLIVGAAGWVLSQFWARPREPAG